MDTRERLCAPGEHFHRDFGNKKTIFADLNDRILGQPHLDVQVVQPCAQPFDSCGEAPGVIRLNVHKPHAVPFVDLDHVLTGHHDGSASVDGDDQVLQVWIFLVHPGVVRDNSEFLEERIDHHRLVSYPQTVIRDVLDVSIPNAGMPTFVNAWNVADSLCSLCLLSF